MSYFHMGLIIFALVFIFDRQLLRVEFSKVASFLGFLAFFVVFQLSLGSYTDTGIVNVPDHAWRRTWMIGRVFYEDALWAIPLYYAFKIDWTKRKWIATALTIVSSISFGMGHIYQGMFAVFLTGLYPYFISLRFGRLYGFGTVMICHIIYDFAVTAILRYGHFMY